MKVVDGSSSPEINIGATVATDSTVEVWRWPKMLEMCLTAGTALQRHLGQISIKFRQTDSQLFVGGQPLQVIVAEFAWKNEVFAEVSSHSSLPEGIVITDRYHRDTQKVCRASEELISVMRSRLKFRGEELRRELNCRIRDAELLRNL